MGLGGVLLGKMFGLPVVFTLHSNRDRWLLEGLRHKPLRKRILEWLLSRGDKVLVVSKYSFDKLACRKPLFCDKLMVVYNPVRMGDWMLGVRGEKVLSLGRLARHKRVGVVIEAVRILLSRGRGIFLDVVGEGEDEVSLRRLVEELRLQDRVRFWGRVDEETKQSLMGEAGVYVLTSTEENFSCYLIEALSFGVPVVSTPVGVAPEVVNDKTGVIVPFNDPGAVANALEYILEHPEKFPPEECRKMAERFSYDRVREMLERVYVEVIHRRGKCVDLLG